jgi:peptide/nickel transport system substrate-binding protein
MNAPFCGLRSGYDPEKAKALLKAAGYGPDDPAKAEIISTAGSGQMLPLPTNEIIQQQIRPIGYDWPQPA